MTEQILSSDEWWSEFFSDDLYLLSDVDFFDPALTQSMVQYVKIHAIEGSILDLACGPGRHSLPLAQAGFSVTGVDFSDHYLKLAREKAARSGVAARFVKQDMKDLSVFGAGTFNNVISMHTSFGFFRAEEDNAHVIREAARVLAPGGKLIIDVTNRDWFITQGAEVFAVDRGKFTVRNYDDSREGQVFLHEEVFYPELSRITWVVKEIGGRERSYAADYRIYSCHEIVNLCVSSGLVVDAIHGNYSGTPFTLRSEHVICIARKP